MKKEESHSGYCTSLENWNLLRGSWVRVPPPPPKALVVQWIGRKLAEFQIQVRLLSRAQQRAALVL